MALYTTEDVGNISFQQPVSAPRAPAVTGAPSSAKGVGIGAVADIVEALAPGIQSALNNRNPLDDFAKDLEGDLKSVPATAKGAAQRERKIKQRWLEFSIQNPELSDDAAAYTRNVTGYDLTTPSPAVAVNNQINDFFNANPSLSLNTLVRDSNGQVDFEGTFNRRQEVYHREMEKKARANERAARLERLEFENKMRDETAKAISTELAVGWSRDAEEKINALEESIGDAEGPEQALAAVRETRELAVQQFRIEAAENGLRPTEYKEDLDRIQARFTSIETLIEDNLGDFKTIVDAIENKNRLQLGETLTPIMGAAGRTSAGQKAYAEVLAQSAKSQISTLQAAAKVGIEDEARLTGWGTTETIGVPDEDTANQYKDFYSDLSDQPSVQGASRRPVTKPKSGDFLDLNAQVLGKIDINKPDGPKSAKQAAVVITNTVGAINKPLSQGALSRVLNDDALQNINRASQLNDVDSQETVEAISNMASNQMTLAVGAAESRLSSLPKGLGIVYEDKKFRIELTGNVSWGDRIAETPEETQGYAVVDGNKVTAIMGGPGVADVPSGRGVTVIPLKNTSDATFVVRELNKANDSLKAANYLSQRMERVTGIKEEWRNGVDTNFERFAPKAPEMAPMPDNIKLNEGMKPLVNSLEGASEMTRPYAAARMNAVLSGPFQQLQETFGQTLTINDAIAKEGTSREKSTPGSRHFHGDALDIDVSGMTDEEKLRLVDSALKAGFQGFGFGNTILHIDMGKPRAWNYNNETFGGRPVDELIEGVRSNVGSLPNLPMVDTGQQPTDEEELGMEADPREGRPTNYIEFSLPTRRTDQPDAMAQAPSAPPFSQQIANDSLPEAPAQIDEREPGRRTPDRPEGEPEEKNRLARQAQEQQMARALQALQKLGVDPSQIPAFNSMEDAQSAIDNGVLKEGDLYEVNGEIEVVEGA